MLEIKKWEDYSSEEQSELLNHWWHYYGKMIYTFEELEKFNELIKKYGCKVFKFAVVSFICGQSSQTLIQAMRLNKIDELMAALSKIDENEIYIDAKNVLIAMLVESYNNPEPSIPMEPEVIKEQIEDIILK